MNRLSRSRLGHRFIGVLLCCSLAACSPTTVFVVVSDPHFTGNALSDSVNRLMVDDMNRLVSDSLMRSKHIQPEFVWMLGDMTDAGTRAQWDQYEAVYGLNGEHLLRYPVMECFGNHDGGVDGIVRSNLRERNKKRAIPVNTDSLGLHYSWDMNGVHFVNLNLYPGNDWDPSCDWCKYFHESFREPQFSLRFLEEDLKLHVGETGRPIILAFHIGFDDFSRLWWTDNDRERFFQTIIIIM